MMGYSIQISTISTFIANTVALNAICGEIDSNIGSSIPQPVLVIGQEGSGKTTLFRRLITKYPSLHFVWIDGRFIFSSTDIIEQVSGDSILIIDNLDYFFDRCSYEEQFRLRRFIYNEGAPMMIASVSKLIPALTEYKAPFFEGLKKIHLPPITDGDLKQIFSDDSIDRALTMFNFVQPTINSVKIISNIIEAGGNPKEDMYYLLSYYSIIYRNTYNSMPTNSQHILNILCNSEKDMTVPDIREASGLTSGILTPYLKSLKGKGLITKDSSVKRSTKYFIKDPLFRIWLKKETL
jgi:GTPase SAR1 family protein